MLIASLLFAGILTNASATAKAVHHPGTNSLVAHTTLPIVFTRNIDAAHAHAGDPVIAKTTQVVKLQDGSIIPAGSRVIGSVVEATPFVFDKTPYAKQHGATLTVRFNEVQAGTEHLLLRVYVRAIADSLTANAARQPMANDDTLDTVEQVGGDELRPSQAEVISRDGDVVAYNRRDGVFGHLIAHVGNSPYPCGSSSDEEAVGIFSASACGLYGFQGSSAKEVGSNANPSTLSLVSIHQSPKIWQHSVALLEVLPWQAGSKR
jgi:hypothetical protein